MELQVKVRCLTRPDGDRENARYPSRSIVLKSYKENGDNRVKFGRNRLTFDVRGGMISALMALNRAGDKALYLSVTGGRYLQTDLIYP